MSSSAIGASARDRCARSCSASVKDAPSSVATTTSLRWIETAGGPQRVTVSSLDWAVDHLGLDADDTAKRLLVAEYRRLAPFPEVPAALDAMARTRPLAILSNGHPEMLEAVVEHNKLRNFFRGGVLSVHAAKTYKPHPSVYALAEDHLGVPRSVVGFVSSNGWDAAGARAFGFQVFWINRGKAPVERLGVRPDATFPDLAELSTFLAG